MVEANDKKRKNSPANKIGMKEDEVNGEEVGQVTQIMSAFVTSRSNINNLIK